MDIEPPIKPANDSDDNKSNDSTASQPQHLQEMAKSTVVMKETPAPVAPNDNANVEVLAPINEPSPSPQQLQSVQLVEPIPIPQVEAKPVETASSPTPTQQPILNTLQSVPPAAPQIPPAASVPVPSPQSQEAPIQAPNVNVTHLQGVGLPGSHLPPPPHGAFPGYAQGPPRGPFYGHMPPYQQGFQQYPYGHHMPPYQQNYHGPHGYPVPGHPPGAENHNPYQQGPAMHAPIPHQPLIPAPASVAAAPAAQPQPEEAAEKNGS